MERQFRLREPREIYLMQLSIPLIAEVLWILNFVCHFRCESEILLINSCSLSQKIINLME